MLNTEIISRLIPFLEIHKEGLKRQELLNFLTWLSPRLGISMLPRRISTILSWLKDLEIIIEQNGKYFLSNGTRDIQILAFNKESAPIIPTSSDLNEYNIVEHRTSLAQASIKVQRNQVAVERANRTHRELVNLVASRLRNVGCIPKANQLIDLATRYESRNYIFEMKSTTSINVRDQIRKGISQLYEYRYLQNNKDALLVLVLDAQISENHRWLEGYLQEDREIKLIWDGNENLFAHQSTKDELNFLFE